MELSDEHKAIVGRFTEKLGYPPGIFRTSRPGKITPAGTLILVRGTDAQEFRRFTKKSTEAMMAAASPKKRQGAPELGDAQREVARCCVVYPEDDNAKTALFDDLPGLVPKLCDKATALGGDDVEEFEGN
jgi:hypothetical protein